VKITLHSKKCRLIRGVKQHRSVVKAVFGSPRQRYRRGSHNKKKTSPDSSPASWAICHRARRYCAAKGRKGFPTNFRPDQPCRTALYGASTPPRLTRNCVSSGQSPWRSRPCSQPLISDISLSFGFIAQAGYQGNPRSRRERTNPLGMTGSADRRSTGGKPR